MFPFTTVMLAALLLLVSLAALHKLRRVHLLLHDIGDHSRQDTAALFRQVEALHGLYVDLDLRHSLPATRGWAASPDFLAELATHVRSERPRVVVECSSGASTLVIARCLQLNGGGRVYSLEHDPLYARQTRMQLARHGLGEYAEVLDAPLCELTLDGARHEWYDHALLPPMAPIDLLVIDGPPQDTCEQARYPAGPLLFPKLGPSAAVFLDDAKRPAEAASVARWRAAFPALMLDMRHCEKGCAVLRVPAWPSSLDS